MKYPFVCQRILLKKLIFVKDLFDKNLEMEVLRFLSKLLISHFQKIIFVSDNKIIIL